MYTLVTTHLHYAETAIITPIDSYLHISMSLAIDSCCVLESVCACAIAAVIAGLLPKTVPKDRGVI